LQKFYKQIQAAGGEIIAISSDNEARTKATARRVGADFPVLADVKQETIAAYNATDPFNKWIARPQTYLIDPNGVIRWKFVDIRVGHRVNAAEVLAELQKL
jgi:peroxiredoxin